MPSMGMPIDPQFPGLSDLGMGGQGSESNSVGDPDAPMVLDQLLAESRKLKSPEARALAIEEAQAKLAATETPSQLDELLKNPVSLLKLLGAGVAAAKGQPGLAAGIGLGTVGKAGQLAAEKKQAKIEQQTQLQEQHEQALERIDKQQARIANIMVANPDALEGIDPVSLGVLITGREMPMDPTSKRMQLLNTEKRKEKYELMVKRLTEATTDQDRRTIVDGIEKHMGWKIPDEVKTAMSREVDGEYQTTINKNLMQHVFFNPKSGQTGLDAFQRAVDAGEEDQLWKYVGDVAWTEDGNEISIPDETWKLINRINQWWADPSVPQEDKLATGGDLEKIANIVFREEPGSLTLLRSKLSASAPWLTGMDAASIALRTNGQLNQFGQVVGVSEYLGADEEGRADIIRQRTAASIAQADDTRRGAAVANVHEKVTTGATRMSQAVPGYGTGTYIDFANRAIDRASKTLGEGATAADFDREYDRILNLYIEELKRRQGNAK